MRLGAEIHTCVATVSKTINSLRPVFALVKVTSTCRLVTKNRLQIIMSACFSFRKYKNAHCYITTFDDNDRHRGEMFILQCNKL